MNYSSSFSYGPADLKRSASEIEYFPRHVVDRLGEMIYGAVQVASLGQYSTAQLLSMYDPYGPYSVRSPHPPADPRIINFQTGTFYRSWVQTTRYFTDVAWIRTYNVAPYANALARGTDFAIARALPELVMERVSKPLSVVLETSAKKALG